MYYYKMMLKNVRSKFFFFEQMKMRYIANQKEKPPAEGVQRRLP